MLQERYPVDVLRRVLMDVRAWKPFPQWRDRGDWEAMLASALNARRKESLVAQAANALRKDWPALPASLYLEFSRNGNRAQYERPYFDRRSRLGMLVLAECFEGRRRFVDEILNGVYAILEESTWCLPAHLGAELPDTDKPVVDLFAAETAATLSEALYLVGDVLEEVSPVTVRRIKKEIGRRVVVPVETRQDFWWYNGRNNWTPWCCANVLGAAFYVVEDRARLAALSFRLMGFVDRFIGLYEPDGGCDEGPSYWTVAAGALLLFLEHLHSRSGGEVSIYDEPVIAAMGKFITAVHLDGSWFFNFGDGSARGRVGRAVTHRYGERIGDEGMCKLAALSARNGKPDGAIDPPLVGGGGAGLSQGLRELFWFRSGSDVAAWRKPIESWLPNLEVVVVRETTEPGRGFVLGAKGGNNDASHNHNDVGQFVLWYNGVPMIIDLGVETYTRKTFSPERYTLWTIRSSGHNVPMINGCEQSAGKAFCARDVGFTSEAGRSVFTADIAPAYPETAGLRSLRRECVLDRASPAKVRIRDHIVLKEKRAGVEVLVPLFTTAAVAKLADGRLILETDGGSVEMTYDPAVLSVSVEGVDITDSSLRGSWPERLNRIDLRRHLSGGEGSSEVAFRAM